MSIIKNWLKIVRNLAFLGAGILILIFTFRGHDLQSIVAAMKQANYAWLGMAMLAAMLSHYLRALRWKLLIQPLHANPGTKQVFAAVMIGYLANLGAPRLGEVMRCWTLNRSDNISTGQLFGTVVTERIIDSICLVLIICFVVILKFNLIGAFLYNQLWLPMFESWAPFWHRWWIWIAAAVLLSVVLLLIAYLLRKHPFVEKIFEFGAKMRTGLATIGQMKAQMITFIVYSAGIWLLYICSMYFTFLCFSATSSLTFGDAILVFVFSSLAMAAPIQGGIGAFHWMVVKGLGLLGIGATTGLALATLNYGATILMIIVAGCIALLWHFSQTYPQVVKPEKEKD